MEKPLLMNSFGNLQTFPRTLFNSQKPSFGDDDSMESFKFGTIYLVRHKFYLKFICEFCGKQYENFENFIRDSVKHIMEQTWKTNSNILLEKALRSKNKEKKVPDKDDCSSSANQIPVEEINPTIPSSNEMPEETPFINEVFIKQEPFYENFENKVESDIDEQGIELSEANGCIFERSHDINEQLLVEESPEVNSGRSATIQEEDKVHTSYIQKVNTIHNKPPMKRMLANYSSDEDAAEDIIYEVNVPSDNDFTECEDMSTTSWSISVCGKYDDKKLLNREWETQIPVGMPLISNADKHFPKKLKKRVRCRVCSANKKRTATRYACEMCKTATGIPIGLCIEKCFKLYHINK